MARLTVGTPRMKKILIERVTNANTKGKGYKFSAGYNSSWTDLAKAMAEQGTVVIKHGRIYMTALSKKTAKQMKAAKKATMKPKRAYVRKSPATQEPEQVNMTVRKFKRAVKETQGIPAGKPAVETLVSSVMVPPSEAPTMVKTSVQTNISAVMLPMPVVKEATPADVPADATLPQSESASVS